MARSRQRCARTALASSQRETVEGPAKSAQKSIRGAPATFKAQFLDLAAAETFRERIG